MINYNKWIPIKVKNDSCKVFFVLNLFTFTINHDFDGPSCPSSCRFKSLDRFFQLEAVSNQGFDINQSRGNLEKKKFKFTRNKLLKIKWVFEVFEHDRVGYLVRWLTFLAYGLSMIDLLMTLNLTLRKLNLLCGIQ